MTSGCKYRKIPTQSECFRMEFGTTYTPDKQIPGNTDFTRNFVFFHEFYTLLYIQPKCCGVSFTMSTMPKQVSVDRIYYINDAKTGLGGQNLLRQRRQNRSRWTEFTTSTTPKMLRRTKFTTSTTPKSPGGQNLLCKRCHKRQSSCFEDYKLKTYLI